jgi:DNA invertase Pin-like site-specific DNA recombinase
MIFDSKTGRWRLIVSGKKHGRPGAQRFMSRFKAGVMKKTHVLPTLDRLIAYLEIRREV